VNDQAIFRTATLDNGLQIVAELHPQGYTASFGYFVRAGARDETDAVAGVSHFLEHMMFKGTPTRSAAEVNRQLDELGGQSNAFTSEEQTVYYASVIPKYQQRIVELLTDIMRPTLRSEDFETERLVILEEIAKYDDQPPFGAFERSMEEYFGSHGLGRRILGSVETVSKMTPAQMREYFDARYGPESIVLAAAGNVDFDALVMAADKLTASWRTTAPATPRQRPNLDFSNPPGIRSTTIQAADAVQIYNVRVGAAPGATDPDRYPMRLLASVLGDESGSRMFWELIDTGRAEVAVSWTQEFDDCGLMFLYLVGQPDDTASNLRLVDQIIERIQADGVTEEELNQAINKVTAGLVLQSERPGNRMFSIGHNWITRGAYDPLDDLLRRYRSVTPDAVKAVMEKYPLQPVVQVQTAP
jgi:predicted Zn-dependent peptidase